MFEIPMKLKEVVKNIATPTIYGLSYSQFTHDVHLNKQYTHQVDRDVNRLLARGDEGGEPIDLCHIVEHSTCSLSPATFRQCQHTVM